MKLAVSDFRSIPSVHIDIRGVTLIAGPNAAGKSSICMALGACLTMQPIPALNAAGKPALAKKDAFLLLRSGRALASAVLEHGDGTVTIVWPGCTVSTTGKPPSCSLFAAGLARLTSLHMDDRARVLQEMLGASPTIDDLRAALPGLPEGHVRVAWDRIQRDGWDNACSEAKSRGAELKGRWREVTGQAYGSAKAQSWRPKALVEDDLAFDDVDLQRRLEDAQQRAGDAAVAAAKAKAREGVGGKIAAAREALGQAQTKVKAAKDALDKALAARAQAPEIHGDSGVPCPWCQKNVRIARDPDEQAYYRLEKFEQALTKDEHLRRRKALSALDKAVSEATEAHRAAEFLVSSISAEIRVHEACIAEEPAEVEHGEDVEAVRARVSAVYAYRRAQEIAAMIAANAAVVEALSPSGVRAAVMGKALFRLNEAIDSFVASCDEDGYAPPTILPDMSVTCSGRPYELLSESERFRADVAIQVALARICGDAIVVIDGADVLDKDGRNALFGGLVTTGTPAVVAMTLSDKALMPDLAKYGGISHWVDGAHIDA